MWTTGHQKFKKNALLLLNEISHILCNDVVVAVVAVVAVVVNNNAANFKFCAYIFLCAFHIFYC